MPPPAAFAEALLLLIPLVLIYVVGRLLFWRFSKLYKSDKRIARNLRHHDERKSVLIEAFEDAPDLRRCPICDGVAQLSGRPLIDGSDDFMVTVECTRTCGLRLFWSGPNPLQAVHNWNHRWAECNGTCVADQEQANDTDNADDSEPSRVSGSDAQESDGEQPA